MRNVRIGTIFAALASAALAGGCYEVEQPPTDQGPGSEGWASREISCETDDQCHPSESCLQGVCQMKRCQNGPYASKPPIGKATFFFQDRDPVVADASTAGGTYRVSGYEADQGAASYGSNWAMDDRPVADVAGGDVWPGRPEEVITATSGRSNLTIVNSEERGSFDLGMVPVALAVGDLEGDGVAEILGLGTSGRVRVCHVEEKSCENWNQVFEPGFVGADLDAGDVDGDGRDEAVILGKVDGDSRIVVLNFDGVEGGGNLTWGLTQGGADNVDRLAVGDLDGDLVAEVVALRDGYTTWVYTMAAPDASRVLAEWPTYLYDAEDVAVGDLDMDDVAEVLILRADRQLKTLRARKNGQDLDFDTLFESELDYTASPNRIATADFDGDSPMAKLVEGPILRSSRPVPLFVAFYPPYWAQFSDTPANVYVGESELTTETLEDAVFMRGAVELGVQGNVLGLFESGLSGKVERRITTSEFETNVRFVGTRVWTQADTDLYGLEYGAVLMAASCAHQYVYEIDDPMQRLEGGHGGRFTLMLPVDGSSLLMATQRYNALAETLGDLPIIEVPHRIGDPTTYPREMQTLEGFPIPEQDKVVKNPPSYVVSDVGYLGFWLALWEYEGETSTMETSFQMRWDGAAPGFKWGLEAGTGWSRSHTLQIGKEAVFGGNLPTLPDDPETPEDEFAMNAYSFAPIVYRANYQDSEGKTNSYYVFHYMVGLPE